ncbi:acyl-CoA synthetase [Sphingobium boeckii]|uniref:Long-chain acyl-CoA synthetase n=1 Tax=Sphingobium boeckii TaxID=1082345 RepID=A0A7W9AI58_9SPHN|nr:acyl-CoA synthetase [Sphingobium boeckii]MBB5685899.1 long-chain acyl-CoA synthetase [Sphingobium boeckii]
MHPSVHAENRAGKPAFIMGATGETVNYAQLEARSNQGAHLFRSMGLSRGDGLAVMLDNNRFFLEVIWAAQRAGLYYTCISTRLVPAEVAFILDDSGAKALVTAGAIVPDIAQAARDLGIAILTVGGGERDFEVERAKFPETPIADQSPGNDMLYSSGTTGRPKGIRPPLPEGSLAETNPLTELGQTVYGMDSDTVFLSPAPLYHAAPLRWCMSVQKLGGTVIIMEKFDAEEALALIERYRVTHAQWVPTHFIRMLKLEPDVRARHDTSSLKTVFHAAAPCPVPVKQAMMDWWGPIIHEFYGGTEANGLTSIGPEEWLARPGSVGRPMWGRPRICDDDGHALPPRETGTIFFADGAPFSYHNDPEKTAASRNRHGWTTIGDVGWLDEEGYLYLTDRKSFMIISGGVNIYPQEIEDALVIHPKVADVAVIGAPDPDMGEKVVAVVQPADWADAGEALAGELMDWLRPRIGKVKLPRQIDFDRELPRNPTGKLVKRLVRDRYWP